MTSLNIGGFGLEWLGTNNDGCLPQLEEKALLLDEAGLQVHPLPTPLPLFHHHRQARSRAPEEGLAGMLREPEDAGLAHGEGGGGFRLIDALLVGGVVVELLRGHTLLLCNNRVQDQQQLPHPRTLPRTTRTIAQDQTQRRAPL